MRSALSSPSLARCSEARPATAVFVGSAVAARALAASSAFFLRPASAGFAWSAFFAAASAAAATFSLALAFDSALSAAFRASVVFLTLSWRSLTSCSAALTRASAVATCCPAMVWASPRSVTRRTASKSPFISAMRLPSLMRHSRASLLAPAEAMTWPSGRTATAVTGPPWSKRAVCLPLAMSQIRTLPSSPPETSCVPAGSTRASDVTPFVCPFHSRIGTRCLPGDFADDRDHARITPSAPAVKSCVPCLFKASALMAAGVVTAWRGSPSATLQARHDLSSEPA